MDKVIGMLMIITKTGYEQAGHMNHWVLQNGFKKTS